MRRNLLPGFALGLLVLASARPAAALDRSSLCWRDYPIPTAAVNYEQAFAAETLAPDPITIDGKAITTGLAEKTIDSLLGGAASVVEGWRPRSDQEQCEYLLEVLRQHANSMHLYRLGDLKAKRMSGLFRAAEWQLPGAGTLRAFFHKASDAEPDRAYLFHLTLLPVALDKVQRRKGKSYVLTRPGVPRIEWNIETNRVSISTRAAGR